MYLIMELCRGGELSDLLRKKGYFREQACAALGGMITVHFVQEWVGGATINLVELSNLLVSPVFLSQSYSMLVTAATVRASYTIFYCILRIAF